MVSQCPEPKEILEAWRRAEGSASEAQVRGRALLPARCRHDVCSLHRRPHCGLARQSVSPRPPRELATEPGRCLRVTRKAPSSILVITPDFCLAQPPRNNTSHCGARP